MQPRLSSQERLNILQRIDDHWHWYSLDDKRLCAICERIIDGHQIEIRGGPDRYTLHCPTTDCPANSSHWLLYHEPAVTAKDTAETTNSPIKGEMSFLWADR